MITIDELWDSTIPADWERALQRYWDFVKASNIALEHRMEELNSDYLRQLDAEGWYEFLRDQYFRWKYTASNRYATTTGRRGLHRYLNENALEELHNIKLRLISLDARDIASGLTVAQEIHGLGCAGASGLLALLYPRHFGTVDQFAVKAMRKVKDLQEADALRSMNEDSLTTRDGVVLILIMQCKAAQLNALFKTLEWTPRKIDMILWTCGRQSDPPKVEAQASRETISAPRPAAKVLQRNQDQESPLSNHAMIAFALESYRGKIFTTSEIKTMVLGAFPHFSKGSLLPNDHAGGNKSPCSCAGTDRRIFDRVEPGRYLIL